tara:strand:+ start:6700 stop:7359 length:660 start_codon:yes stop_codon:yes gene_type:complete
MPSQSQEAPKGQPPAPELIPAPPPVTSSKAPEGYKPASEDIENLNQLNLVENFIGSIYGEAKQIDKSNIGDSKYTRGLTFDAKQEILNLRSEVHQNIPSQQLQSPGQQPIANQTYNSARGAQPVPPPVHPTQHMQNNNIPAGDSLILKHEIDQIKQQVIEIKKLYDEFFKLKVVKGSWLIRYDDKEVKSPTIAKTWNTVNKLLKNKSKNINIEYIESND